MSDLIATNCGCSEGRDSRCGGGCGSIIIILLLLSCCGNGNGFLGNGLSCFGGSDDCSCIIIILLLLCGCGSNF